MSYEEAVLALGELAIAADGAGEATEELNSLIELLKSDLAELKAFLAEQQ